MADLTTASRKRLMKKKPSAFGLPAQGAYPMPNRAHAANAKARASQQLARGNLTAAEKAQIDRKANKILGTPGKK